MADTLLTVRTEVLARGFDYLTPTRANRIINDAYAWLVNKYLWPFRATVITDGPAPVTLGSLGPVSEVVDTSDGCVRRLIYRDRAALVERFGDLTTPGSPRYWYFESRTEVATYPAGGTLNIRHYQRAPVLSDDIEVFIVPDGWMQIIVDRACYRAYLDADNAAMARLMREEIDAALEDMVVDLLVRQTSDADEVITYGGEGR